MSLLYKEKAKELVDKFLNEQNNTEEISEAKQCALICVNELIEIMDEEGYDEEDTEIVYLEEVKSQINLC
jgi:DNA-directed RNA polymerase specialized sigma54-like protein